MIDRTAVLRLLLAAGLLVFTGVVVGCGAEQPRTALVATEPRWVDASRVEVRVECATEVTSTVQPGAGVDGLPLVTVWGHPKAGRCTVPVTLDLPPGTARIDDAASGMVVDLPPRP
jgi:hypothetical protein